MDAAVACLLAATLIIFQPCVDGRPTLIQSHPEGLKYQTKSTPVRDLPLSWNTPEEGVLASEKHTAKAPPPGGYSSATLKDFSPTEGDFKGESSPGAIPELTPEEWADVVEKILDGELQPVIDDPAARSDDVPFTAKAPLSSSPPPVTLTKPILVDSASSRKMHSVIENPSEDTVRLIDPVFPESSLTQDEPLDEIAPFDWQHSGDEFSPLQDFIPPSQDDQLEPFESAFPHSPASVVTNVPFDESAQEHVPDELLDFGHSDVSIDDPGQDLVPDEFSDFQKSDTSVDKPSKGLLRDELVGPQRSAVPVDKPGEEPVPDELVNSQLSRGLIVEPVKQPVPDDVVGPLRSTGKPEEEPVPDEFVDPQRSTVPTDEQLKEPLLDERDSTPRPTQPMDKPFIEPLQDEVVVPNRSTVPIDRPLKEPVLDESVDLRPAFDVPIDKPVQEPQQDEVIVPHQSTVPIDEPFKEPVLNESVDLLRPDVPMDKPEEEPVPDELVSPQRPTFPMDEHLRKRVPDEVASPERSTVPIDKPLKELARDESLGPQQTIKPKVETLNKLASDAFSDSLRHKDNSLPMDVVSETSLNTPHVPKENVYLTPSQAIPSFLKDGFAPAANVPIEDTATKLSDFPQNSEHSLLDVSQVPPQDAGKIPETLNTAYEDVPLITDKYAAPATGGVPRLSPADVQPLPDEPPLLPDEEQQFITFTHNVPETSIVADTTVAPSVTGGPSKSQNSIAQKIPGSSDPNAKFLYHTPTYQGSRGKPKIHSPAPSTSPRPQRVETTPGNNVGTSIKDPRINFPVESTWSSSITPKHKFIPKQPNVWETSHKILRDLNDDLLSISDVLDSMSDSRSAEMSEEMDSGEEDSFLRNIGKLMDYEQEPDIVPSDVPESLPQKDTSLPEPPTDDLLCNVAVSPVNEVNTPKQEIHRMRIPRYRTSEIPEVPINTPSSGLEELNPESPLSEVVSSKDIAAVNSREQLVTSEGGGVVTGTPETMTDPADFTTTEWSVDESILTTETPGVDDLYPASPQAQVNDQVIGNSESGNFQRSEGELDYHEGALREENFQKYSHASKRSPREDLLSSRRTVLSGDVGRADEVRELNIDPEYEEPREDIRFSVVNPEIFTTDEPLLAEDKPPLEFASDSTSLQDQQDLISERTDLNSVEEDNASPTSNKNHSVSKKDNPMNTLDHLPENMDSGDKKSSREIVINSAPDDLRASDYPKPLVDGGTTRRRPRVRRSMNDTDPLLAALLEDSANEDSTPHPSQTIKSSTASINSIQTPIPFRNTVEPSKLPSTISQTTTETFQTAKVPSTTLPSTTTFVRSTPSSTPVPPSTTHLAPKQSTTYEPLPTPVPETVPLTSTSPPSNSTAPKKKTKKVWNIPFYPHNVAISSNGQVHLEPKDKSAKLPETTTSKPLIRSRIKPEDLEAARERLLKRFQSRRPSVTPDATLLQRSHSKAPTPNLANPNLTPVKLAVPPAQPHVNEDVLAFVTAQNPSQLPSLLYNSPEEREDARRRRLRNMVGLAGDVRSFLSDRARHAMHSVGRIVGGDEPKKNQPT